jgi:hypothetical protein
VLINPEWMCQHKTDSRKDGKGPAEGQPPEMRDGFRIVRLVMSIIVSRIFLLRADQGKEDPKV